ncbi:translocation/assembly module TamB domain-containing protein [uncultured Thiocystis sp.]|jgi:translocation and assembly module TamB|uniref:translocation/assembly module TamB domain-containing protein n=1 Tax=uncultured Thiocystis sp. TaxID=1202134 RepID=UPI0025DDA075|nr:translocation/assembly module TamB domain-containing protein [uncultured Thiocystis sp.]
MSERSDSDSVALDGGLEPSSEGADVPPADEKDARSPSPRRWRLPWLIAVPLQLLLVLILLIGLTLGTQTGLRVAIALAEDLVPGILSVAQVDGRALGRLHLAGIKMRLPAIDLTIGTLDLDWSLRSVFSGILSVRQLAVRDLDLVVAPSLDEEKEPFVLPEIVLPLRVELGDVLVERLRVFAPGEEKPGFVLDRAMLSAHAQGSEVNLTRVEVRIQSLQFSAIAQGRANLLGHYPLDLDLDWDMSMAPAVQLTGKGRIGGDLQRLTIQHRVTGAVEVELDAHVQNVLERPSWDGLIKIPQVDLPAFRPDLPAVETVARLETRGNLDAATLTGTVDARAPNLPDFGHLAVALEVLWKERVLSIRALELTEQVSEAVFSAQGQVDLNPSLGHFSLKGNWKRLRWPLIGDLVAQSPRGELELSGDFDAFAYALSTEALGPGFPAARLTLQGSGKPESTHLDTLRIEALGGLLEGSGDLTWSPAPTWNLTLVGRDLNPGEFVAGLEDRLSLRFASQGGLDGFDYDLAATTVGPGLPPATLTLNGTGDRNRTDLNALRLDLLDGRIDGQAKVAFAPRLTWEASLALAGINPGAYAPDWPGRIDGRLTSQGTLEDDGPTLTAVIEGLQGTLRGYPVAAAGTLAIAGKTLRIEGLTAESGPSRARIDGMIDERLELAFALESPDLASLLPEARGRLTATGKIQGTLDAPRIALDLSATDAELAGQGIASLSGTAEVDLAPNGRFALQLDGKNLFAGGMQWSTLALRGDGSMPDHRLSASLSGDPLSLTLAATGALAAGGAYRGQLATLDLKTADFGAWRLQRPTPFSLEQPKIAAGPLCLRHDKGSGGCVTFDQADAGQWTAGIDLDKFDFNLLAGLLPENLTAEGGARLKGRFQAAAGVLDGTATAEIPNGRVRLALGQGKSETLDFSNTRLTLDAGARGLSARLGLSLKELGEIEGDLNLPGWRLDAPARPGQPLNGRVRANVQGLARIANLLPDISKLSGALDADLTLGGTLAEPGVKGRANLRNVNFEVPLIALKVKDLNLSAIAPTLERMELQGQASIGGGRLELSGDSRFGGGGFAARLKASGERLQVANTKEYFAIVSPTFDLEATSKGASLRGEIRVPEARIRPRAIPAGTISPSSDVVLEDPSASPSASNQKPPYPLYLDIRLVLGDEVTIDAFGVRGRLAGNLSVQQTPGKDMLGDGQLQIVEGEYRLSGGFGLAAELGAPLTITQGRLLFAKSPIGNPGLLLQAEREGGDTTAGVRVLGTLRNPKLAFFSESDPGMTQAEITKYLMTGIPPSANDRSDQAGLAVGTYIAPKIYMEYESGLGQEDNKVRLRYDLSRHIELQTETGENPGADIYFKFEN